MYNLAEITKKLYEADTKLFSTNSLRTILNSAKEPTFYNLIKRLVENDVLVRLERGKYKLKEANVHEFKIANFIYHPSYVSFESALNYYGALSQFPQNIYSATTNRSQEKKFENKVYSYHQLEKSFFGGYTKKDKFLIASLEKALVDQIYLTSKGIKSIDIDELDLSEVDINNFLSWTETFPKNNIFKNLVKKVKDA